MSASRLRSAAPRGAIVAAALLLSACAARGPVPSTGFLGDYSMLRPEVGAPPGDPEPALIHIDPHADFADRAEVLIEPVSVWLSRGSANDPALRADLERLADGLEIALRRHLAQDFALVERAGPGTLRLRAAISEAPRADAPLDFVSLPSRPAAPEPGAALAPKTRLFVAGAAIEAEALDARSNRRLAAAVDPRAAPRLLGRDVASWGDVQEAWDAWADGVQAALAAFRRTARGEDPLVPAPAR